MVSDPWILGVWLILLSPLWVPVLVVGAVTLGGFVLVGYGTLHGGPVGAAMVLIGVGWYCVLTILMAEPVNDPHAPLGKRY